MAYGDNVTVQIFPLDFFISKKYYQNSLSSNDIKSIFVDGFDLECSLISWEVDKNSLVLSFDRVLKGVFQGMLIEIINSGVDEVNGRWRVKKINDKTYTFYSKKSVQLHEPLAIVSPTFKIASLGMNGFIYDRGKYYLRNIFDEKIEIFTNKWSSYYQSSYVSCICGTPYGFLYYDRSNNYNYECISNGVNIAYSNYSGYLNSYNNNGVYESSKVIYYLYNNSIIGDKTIIYNPYIGGRNINLVFKSFCCYTIMHEKKIEHNGFYEDKKGVFLYSHGKKNADNGQPVIISADDEIYKLDISEQVWF